ncbi:hypothetical protein BJ170DRAFT_593263 [Xylariales sp. AK1849]|nr:hypothetical protein BJ170DRAFT_593263 [Xylariales sp. AK1849]
MADLGFEGLLVAEGLNLKPTALSMNFPAPGNGGLQYITLDLVISEASHSLCHQDNTADWLPSRLLDISGVIDRATVHLRERHDNNPESHEGPVKYITLSHVWGQERFCTLTSETVGSLKNGERWLSPRTMHIWVFPFWECTRYVASEACALPGYLKWKDWYQLNNLRLIAGQNPSPSRRIPAVDWLLEWQYMVHAYSRMHLTRNPDKLLALSGVARVISGELKCDYLAGIWSGRTTGISMAYRGIKAKEPHRRLCCTIMVTAIC